MAKSALIAPKRPALFGLDIGTETIKAVQLERRHNEIHLRGCALAPMPARTVKDGVITEPEKVAEAITSLLKEHTIGRIDATSINASLPAGKIFTRLITLPGLKAKELEQAVSYEVGQSFPVALESLYIDWTPVASYKAGKEARLDLLVAAAPRTVVDSYLKLFEIAHLDPIGLETELESISRAMALSHEQSTPLAIADIGAETTDISIIAGGSLRLAGTVPTGGVQFSQAVGAALAVSGPEGDQAKIRYGLSGEDAEAERVRAAITPLLEPITTEIRRMIRFYQDRSASDLPIRSLILTGGSSSMRSLSEYLATELGLSVDVGDPWKGVQVPSSAQPEFAGAPIYTTAIGLALGGLDAGH